MSYVNNNSIEIKPEFFRTGMENPQSKGIQLRSLNKEDNLTSARKGRQDEEMSGSRLGRGRDDYHNQNHDHRFDYLMNNLAATQADGGSTQFVEDSRSVVA